MKSLLALPLLLIAFPDRMPIPAHAPGRVSTDGRFGWPGVYFEGRFKGADVTVRVETGGEPVRVLVDGAVRATLAEAKPSEFSVTGLAPGEHIVRLEKVTESQSGGPRFLGFSTKGNAMPARPRARQIEFIGDSHSVGYGNTSPTRECDADRVRATTDTQLAFGPLAARALNADYRVIAYSGYGIVRNYSGRMPGENLPFLYPRAVPGDAAAAAPDPAWRPRVIVINLGTNDFSTALKPGEAWPDEGALHADYRAKYADFIRALKHVQPQARFVLMAPDRFAADVAAVAKVTGASLLNVPALELTGCNWHPSLKDHRAMADLVEKAAAPLF
ncbi:SGNH/GDSL hydrolase family protein [Sphingomonas soli]|uniref:SGNH/GDSL hydrolase family protein n=1 Tax=Sphingomonas soli TaxID=266127 RepID=UPI00082C97F0|nr:SGNH/GDSL hydrolase family protein [Sphingomonas soli]